MKKIYSKPKIFIEEFKISQSVASGCSIAAGFYSDKCGIPYDGEFENETLFSMGVGSVCSTKPVAGDDDKYCYHVPTDSKRYFGS